MPDTKKKYCSSCHDYRAVEGGQNVRNKHGEIVRWRCYTCKERALARSDEIGLSPKKNPQD